jgi:7-carboxy-7-deazaguanine synthase
MDYKVTEIFGSINGEGPRAGRLALFVRFYGCNLNCSYCDTKRINDGRFTIKSGVEICEAVERSGLNLVTITGGEPLIRPGMSKLLRMLAENPRIVVEIETNGSVDISEVTALKNRPPSLTMDYKLPSSGMEEFMIADNLRRLRSGDVVKFVAGTKEDLLRAEALIRQENLTDKCGVHISPVYGKIDPREIVEFMKEKRLNGVTLQPQIHKLINVR